MLFLYVIISLVSAELVFVAEITRHGARAPLSFFEFEMENWKDYKPGQLTKIGQQQHYELGQQLRKKYIDELRFLADTFNTSEIYAASSETDRTIESAYYHMLGLYPLTNRKTLHNSDDYWSYLHDGAYVTHHENVTIEIVPKNKDHVIRGYDELLCPRIDQIKDILIESKEYLERELELQKFFEEVSAASGLKINSIKIAAKLGSNVYCDVTQGFSFPGALTPEQLAELEKIHGYKKFYYPFSNPEAQNLTCSAFFKELLERIDSAFQKKGVKYAYYSGHDTTLAGFLSCLNLVQDKNPPFASNLIFEVDDNHSVTVIYNDEILKIPDCSSKMCPLDEFKRILTSKILNNLDEACLTK